MTSERITEFSRAGLRFPVVDSGPLDGPTAILLHGFPQTASSWSAVSEILNAGGVRTLAPTQRGYVPTARPRWRWQYRSSQLFADAEALIDRVDGPIHLVGHDWGAHVAWGVAGRAGVSHRPVQSLTAVSVPHSAAFVRALVTSDQALKSWYMLAVQPPMIPETLAALAPARVDDGLIRSGMSPAMAATVRREILDAGALTGALNWYRGMPFASPSAIKRVSVRTSYVWSDRDIALGRTGAELTRRYVTGPYRFEVMVGASHWIPDERPADLARIVLQTIESA